MMLRTAIFTFIFTMISMLGSVQGRHIIGGDFYYNCIGEGLYEFTVVIYRDCSGAGAAFFDSSPLSSIDATVTVYRSDSERPYIESIRLDRPRVKNITPSADDPCLEVPPGICVERGTYTFIQELPVSEHTYTLAYQRCCRNGTINNIVNPNSAGATYFVEIPPAAQRDCLGSLEFENFPPIVICEGKMLEFDHSAIDPAPNRGSEVVYEFCTPVDGGGLAGSGSHAGEHTDPNGVAPDPDMPPPYDEVQFVGGAFTDRTPMGGDPPVTIDSLTGMVTGVPNTLGQFVVGVCASKYDDNGDLISRIRRDFQFNVGDCSPTVTAAIDADSVDSQGRYVMTHCGSNEVTFGNESALRRYIEDVEWSFSAGSFSYKSTDWEPTVEFPSRGTYEGKLVLNRGFSCSDSIEILLGIHGAITSDFTYDYDTCRSGPVHLIGSSSSENGSIVAREWEIDGTESIPDTDEVFHEFQRPGRKEIQFFVRDEKMCESVTTKEIDYFPIPADIVVDPKVSDSCAPVDVLFLNSSYPLDESYDILWEFGDGNQSGKISPTHQYRTAGSHTVRLEIQSPIGCQYSGTLDQQIQVQEGPEADFIFSPQRPDQFQREVSFSDRSLEAVAWQWDFHGAEQSDQQNPVYQFPDTGQYLVSLEVTHDNGCEDTTAKWVDIRPRPTFFLPNAFTPNFDGKNDEFMGKGDLIGVTDFEMLIYNRWGELVFRTSDPNTGWNGRAQNNGRQLPAGVYVCKVRFTGPRGDDYELEGFATLIR